PADRGHRPLRGERGADRGPGRHPPRDGPPPAGRPAARGGPGRPGRLSAGQRRHAGTAAPAGRSFGCPPAGRRGKGERLPGLNLHTKLLSLVLAAALLLCMPTALRRIEEQLSPCRYAGVVESYAAEYEMDPLL